MFGANFQRKYALTDQGVQNTKKGTFWTVIVNLVVMGGVSILYLVMSGLMETLAGGVLPAALPVLAGLVIFALLSFLTHFQQYKATYGLVYGEVKATRLRLAERLRKLPLGFFGKRDLADLTETLMGDVNRMEHVWSHVLGYLYGSYISTAVIAVCLLWYDWRLALACLWGVPVAFGLLFGSRKLTERQAERTKRAAVRVSDGMQEALENVREIRATNQEERYLAGLYRKIDDHERIMIRARAGHRPVRQRGQRHHAAGCGHHDPCGRGADFVRTDRLHAAVSVPDGHHPDLCPLRSEPGTDRRAVCLPGVGRPDECSVRHAHRRRGGNLPAQGTRHCL